MSQTRYDQVAVYTTRLTTCQGTWLEHAPDADEQQRIDQASSALRQQRREALAFHQDVETAHLFSLELFRRPEFAPLHLSDDLIAQILDRVGAPPLMEAADDPAFGVYLRDAALSVATGQVRRVLAAQLRRFLPQYVVAQKWRKAVAIDYNAFRTALGNELSPFLAQMTLEGLARWYEQHESE